MFVIHGGSVARPRAQPRQPSRVPWLKILFGVAILVAFGTAIAVANNSASNRIYQEQVSTDPVVSRAPVPEPQTASAPVAKEWPKVHVEWIQIGTARNGTEVQMPRGDELTPVPAELVDNLPPGVSGIAGGVPTGKGTVVLFTYAQTAPWVYTYWKAEIPATALEGLSH